MRNKPVLGQHFLTSRKVAQKILRVADISPKDTILEIGPGKGILTRELLESGARVVAVEKDLLLYEELQNEFSLEVASGKLELVEGDVRDFSLKNKGILSNEFILVANIPYYLTGNLLRRFVGGDTQPKRAVLLLQKEVAERVVGKGGKESILSILVKAYGQPKYEGVVKRALFRPQPKVDSAILSISSISRDFFRDIDENVFVDLVKKGFSQKRKKLSKNLSLSTKDLDSCNIQENARAEDMTLEMWRCLSRHSQ